MWRRLQVNRRPLLVKRRRLAAVCWYQGTQEMCVRRGVLCLHSARASRRPVWHGFAPPPPPTPAQGRMQRGAGGSHSTLTHTIVPFLPHSRRMRTPLSRAGHSKAKALGTGGAARHPIHLYGTAPGGGGGGLLGGRRGG